MPEITGGQSALLGGRASPEVPFLREFEEICDSFWYRFVLGVFCDFRAFFGVWRKTVFTGVCA